MELVDKNFETRQQSSALKAFLMKTSTKSDLNLYDHLTNLLTKVMDEQPENVVDMIEEVSRDVKQSVFPGLPSALRDYPKITAAETLAVDQCKLFAQPEDADQEDEMMESALPNLNEVSFYMEQGGIGLGREEMQRIFLALKGLVEMHALTRCRFWGKIMGLESNYIIAEVDYKEGDEEFEQAQTEENEEEEREEEPLESEDIELDDLPKSNFKPIPLVPREAIGTGTNKYVYYVCKEPGLPWVKLPPVTPAQITAARQIRRFFTGRLDAPVKGYPPFPGNETNYLRAQIARISAGTLVSPSGFYQASEEEGDEEEEVNYEMNPTFEGIPVSELVDSLSNWVHHIEHILQQGRCTWVSLTVKSMDDSNEEAEGEEEEAADEPEPEVGPPLLTPLSQDAEISNVPPWSPRQSSTLIPTHAVALVHSNLWQGAHAYASGIKVENVYVGWGLKYAMEGFSPPLPPEPQTEYPKGPEIAEALDPSLEEEQAMEDALEEQKAAQEEEEEEDEEEDDQ